MRAAGLLGLLLLAPLVAAQVGIVDPTLTVFVEDPGRAFLPGANETVVVVVNYQPNQGGRPTPAPTPDRPENTAPTRITFAVKTRPSWITSVAFDPPEVLIRMGPENVSRASYPARVNAILAVAPDAPALEREPFLVTATAEPNGNLAGTTADSTELKLRATTVGKLNVTAEPTAVIPGGRWVNIPFTIHNEGNSEIVAKINVTTRPENSQVEFSDTLQLKRNETRIIDVRIRTPWTAAEFGTLALEAVPILDGEPGPAATTEVEVRGESAVPAAGATALLAGLAAAALLARRR